MSRNLPEELVPVLAKLDQHWPQADEDGLRRAAGIWREFGTEAERLARRGGDSAQRVTGENSGPAVDAFAQHWGGFAGGGRGYLDDARTAAEHVATAFDKAAAAAEHCKAELISVLTEVAAEMKKSEADQAKAAAAAKDAGPGLVGLVGQAIGSVHETAAKAAETGAIEVAKLKVAGLLHELGREMKDGLKAALDEPAVITLERIAQADGRGPQGDLRTMSGAGGGQFTGALGGTVGAGAAAVGGVRTLSAVVGPDGEPEVVGPDGKPVKGVKGLKVEIDANGQPVVVGPDGQPVSGVATGVDGKPLKDASGHTLLVGADGSLGNSGLAVEVGADGQPKLGPDGRPVLVGADGNPAGVLGADRSGRPLGAVDLGTDPNGGQNLGVKTAVGPSADIQAGPGGAAAQVSSPDRSWSGGDGGAGGGGRGHGHGEGWGSGGDSYGGQSGSGYRQVATPTYAPDNSYSDTPAPSVGHHGPVSVQTDSIAVAPPDTSAVDASPVGGGGGGGGGGLRGEPVFGGSSPAGGDSGGGFQLGPVGGGAPAGPPVGAPVAAPVGGPGGMPVGTPVGAPVATGAPVPGAPAPGGAPIAGGPVGGGAGGSAGPVAMGVGVGPVPGGAAPRTPAGSGLPGGGGIGSGGGAAAQPGPFPVRVGPDPVVDLRRRMETFPGEGGPSSSPAALGLIPGGLIGGYYIAQALRRPGASDDPAELRTIADSRPYGVPGGLGPVDPAHQAETVRRVPVQEDGIPVPHPDPRAADWAEALNGGGPREPGRANNCVDIALSAVDTFAGHPTCAAPRLPDGPAGERGGRDRAERELGTRFQDLGDGATAHQKLAQVLQYVGPGAQAMLLTLDEYGRTHSWNVVNHEGVLTYLDHQTARQSGEPLYPADHGLWAIALDAECRPFDLTDIQLVATAPKSKAEPKSEPKAEPVPEPKPVSDAQEVPAPAPAVAPVAPAEPTEPTEPAPAAPPRSRLTMHRTPAGQRSTSR